MRVLHFIHRYWPGIGGTENYVREISERFVASGDVVTVATSDADDADLFWNPTKRRLSQREVEHNGVRILRFPLRHVPLAPLSYSLWRYRVFWFLASRPGMPISWLTRLSCFTPWVPELWRWIESAPKDFDVVGAMGILYEPFVVAARQVARRWQVPFVVYPFTHLGAGALPGRDAVSRYYVMRHQVALVKSADRVIAMTSAEGDFYEGHGLPPGQIVVVGAGANEAPVIGSDGERFRQRHNLRGPIIAFLSAMAYDKGATHLVDAVRKLWKQGRAVDLILAGTLLDPFRRYLTTLPAADRERVRVLTSVSEAEKWDLLAAADIVAMPSRTDSFGIIYLEAWLCRKPVIGARAWGINEVISDGEDGLLVPFGDVRALVGALVALLDSPGRRATMGARGAAKVRAHFAWDHCYTKIRDTYLHLVQAS